MAWLWGNETDTQIEIASTEELSNVTFYSIDISVGAIKWKVKRRYNEFYTLHNKLLVDYEVPKDILPSKKVIGTKSNQFIESRRQALKQYLQTILVFLKRTMPKVFVEFLDFHKYEIYFLLQELSAKCSVEADFLLAASKSFKLTPLELYAITEYLKSPFSISQNFLSPLDLGPILDICRQIDSLVITGDSNFYLNSNIVLNKLPFDMVPFKIHTSLHLKSVCLNNVLSLGSLRETLQLLKVNYTSARCISDVIQCDVLHKNTLEGSQKWTSLLTLDLSNNNITEIDKTISLAVNLQTLILNGNKISTITNLTHLPKLEKLSMVNNLVTICDELHTKIGNVKSLNLSQNNIVTTKGFYKVYSLENLDLSCNKITEVDELKYLSKLPCLDNLRLTGNNVSTTVDYRIEVLELFGDRANYICLDNEKASQAELDKVSVLSALKIVREGKTPQLTLDTSSISGSNM